jgi:branched-chain amino acid transport system substrate-binding protein
MFELTHDASRKTFLTRTAAGVTAAAVLGVPNIALGKGEPIRLGLIPPITGANALLGQQMAEGAALTVDEINGRPGKVYDDRPFQLVQEDATNDNQAAVAALNKLLGENVVAVVGPSPSTQVQAMAPVMKNAGLPWFTGGSAIKNSQLGVHNFFRARASDTVVTAATVDFAVSDKHAKNVAILYASDAFGMGGAAAITEELKKRGLTAASSQMYPKDAKDFTSEILKIKQSRADALLCWIQNPSDVALILQQIHSLGLTIPIIGSPSMGNQTVIETARQNANGCYAAMDFIIGTKNPKATHFIDAFQTRWHHLPDVGVGSGWVYDSIYLLADAYKKLGTTDKDRAVAALHQVKGWQGVMGAYNCDPDGNMLHSASIGLIRNEKVTLVKQFTA